ncbi:LysR family transcriptional regulator [Bacillus sp. V3B]|uniref:LysR family transcriptional regulator n=1 Tax=Bacillus sp. V3B TaxID=2804915 RepID=UPI002109AE4B|nr:LysR family transcriptional regulator [Bacillus sp. V3B]MCQ6275499.1 LysR family transcriptional regulator [Bacillus sp. V3B]
MTKDLSGEYLRAIAEQGNFSSAARALFISQPYLSKFIKKLEDELGIELINRNETPITLTYAGERYLAYTDEIEKTYLNMKYEIEAITNMKKGRLTLGINPILGSHTLYNLLPQYISTYPGIEIDLIEETSIVIEQLLLQRKIDISLNMLPIFNPDVMYESLYEERIFLIVSERHKYYRSDQGNNIIHFPMDIQSLTGEKFILLKQGLGLRRLTDQFFYDYSVKPDIILETTNIENAYRLADNGVGLTIIPEVILKNNQLSKSNIYTIGKPPIKYNVVVAYKKGEVLSAPALAFLNMAKDNYKVIN